MFDMANIFLTAEEVNVVVLLHSSRIYSLIAIINAIISEPQNSVPNVDSVFVSALALALIVAIEVVVIYSFSSLIFCTASKTH